MKDIFTPSTDQLLSENWKKMQSGQKPESKKSEVVVESSQDDVDLDTTGAKEEFPVIKSAFEEIFNRMTSDLVVEGDSTLTECNGKKCSKCENKGGCFEKTKKKGYKKSVVSESEDFSDDEIENTYEEDEMISVPKALLDELVSYIEDPMGDEDFTDIDQPEFEELEEAFKYKVVHKKFTDSGKWKFLKKALNHYGSKKSNYVGKKSGKLFSSK